MVLRMYPFLVAVTGSVTIVHVWSSFEYAQYGSRLQEFILKVSRGLGLIHYSLLRHVEEPRKAERTFKIA